MANLNIIFILIDDLGWRDLGCYGSTFYETPHIDRLAAQGLRFTDAYAAAPVCSPTRASILTGKYPATIGLTDWIDWGNFVHPARGRLIDAPYIDHLPRSEYNLANALKDVGYQTWHVGKWHLGGKQFYPDAQGFDVNLGGCAWGLPASGYFSPWHIPTLSEGIPGEYLTDRLTDEAINLLEHNDGRPFFLNLWHYAVHTPLQADPALVRKYEQKSRDLGLDQQPLFAEGAVFPCEHKHNQRISRRLVQSDARYAAMIENLDTNIGRLLAAVSTLGLQEHTVVIFTSDNGGLATAEGSPTCNLPLSEGKGWIYEGGTRVPLIVAGPSIAAGRICSTPITSPDFYPTILDLVGLEADPKHIIDGQSFLPLLLDTPELERKAIFWHYPHYGNQGGTPGSAVRSGDYKLIEFFEDRRLELYNLRDDIGETTNIVHSHPDVAAELHSLLMDWREHVEAKIPAPNPENKQ